MEEIIKLENINNGIVTQLDLENENNILKSKLEETENKYKYLLADLDNVRKRHLKTIQEKEKYEGEKILLDIIDVLDHIDFAKDTKISDTFISTFISSLQKGLINILNKYEVKPIYDKERPVFFDDLYDDAVNQVPVKDKSLDNSIYSVLKKGYFFKDKILRHEQVIINKYQENE